VPAGRSAVAEAYPALWSKLHLPQDRNAHQHDAYSIAAWMRESDMNGNLTQYLCPALTLEERKIADIEGWILGDS
jgi:hypothetical protein